MNSLEKRYKSFLKLVLVAFCGLALLSCADDKSKKMPEEIAYEFVDAIYNSKDIELIKAYSSSKVLKLISHYRSVKMIQRHVMDFSLESATVQINDVGGDFFRKSKKDTKVEIHIRGPWQGGTKADDRFLTMTWEDNQWRVAKISKS